MIKKNSSRCYIGFHTGRKNKNLPRKYELIGYHKNRKLVVKVRRCGGAEAANNLQDFRFL